MPGSGGPLAAVDIPDKPGCSALGPRWPGDAIVGGAGAAGGVGTGSSRTGLSVGIDPGSNVPGPPTGDAPGSEPDDEAPGGA